jgi:hypothetical protein
VPDIGGLLSQYIMHGVIAVAITPGSGKDYYTEFQSELSLDKKSRLLCRK